MKTIIKISLLTCIAIGIRSTNGRTFACGQRALFMTTAIVPYSKTIPLPQGKTVIVGWWWHPFLSSWRWNLKNGSKNFYAKLNGKFYMHRLIMGLPKSRKILVDHIDHNGLNNTESNLRLCNDSQNRANTRKKKNTKSKYLGVSEDKSHHKWKVSVSIKNKNKYIARFPFTPEGEIQAAKAYDKAAKEVHGEFANLNFKDEVGYNACLSDLGLK